MTYTVYLKESIEPEEFEATKSMITMSISEAISGGMLGSLSVDPDSLQGMYKRKEPKGDFTHLRLMGDRSVL